MPSRLSSAGSRAPARCPSSSLYPVIVCAALAGCFEAAPIGSENAAGDECQLVALEGKSPGYPYDVKRFEDAVLPVLASSCGTAGCHGGAAGAGGFAVFASSAAGDCDFARGFNSLAAQVDLVRPDNSAVYVAIAGGLASHPVSFQPGDAPLDAIKGYLDAAAATYQADGGGSVTPPPGASPFDYAVYQATIQPALDGCAAAGCHGSGAGGLTLAAGPAADSAAMEANFIAVTQRTNLDKPASSAIYLRSISRHGGGASNLLADADAGAMLAWIETAKQNAGDGPLGCADPGRFDSALFRDEILPILRGEVGPAGPATACTNAACHGAERSPGSLVLKNDADLAANLQQFACFVDLASPSTSEVLVCPLDQPGCRRSPHPGGTVLTGIVDASYQRLLTYVYAAKTDATPYDYAFFVRRINPMFGNRALSDPAAGGRSCADAVACHGVTVAGLLPANASNFPLLASAGTGPRMVANFASAVSFVNLNAPDESALYLYPTDEIADQVAHPLATGVPHTGGQAFAPDSPQAADLLTWARGLRPDGDGHQRNWLVAGDYTITTINDATAVTEATVTPAIFQQSFGRLLGGEWDGLFSPTGSVDLAAAFPGSPGTGRAVYAMAYLINTTDAALAVQLEVDSPNAAKLIVDGVALGQGAGGSFTAPTTLPSFRVERKVTRVLVKLLQRPDDLEYRFTFTLRDGQGRPLTDDGGEVVVKLGAKGGI